MSELAPFAICQRGQVIVLGDGPELLVFSGRDDSPMWKHFLDDVLMGVAVTQDSVVALEGDGTLRSYRLVDGEPGEGVRLDIQPVGLRASAEGVLAVIGKRRVLIVHPGLDPIVVDIAGATAVGFGPDSASLAVGTAGGTLHAIDASNGGSWGSIDLGASVGGVAWSRLRNSWLATAGQAMHIVRGDAQERVERFETEAAAGRLALNVDATIVAIEQGGQSVAIYAMSGPTKVGDIWLQRPIMGLDFGPKSWLGIGFTDGDANRVELFSGQMTRTMAHPGRSQNAWPLQVQVNSTVLRGEVARLAAGTDVLAKQVRAKASSKGGMSLMKKLMYVALAFFLLSLACGCCGGLFSFVSRYSTELGLG